MATMEEVVAANELKNLLTGAVQMLKAALDSQQQVNAQLFALIDSNTRSVEALAKAVKPQETK